jgi:hypothetical protein
MGLDGAGKEICEAVMAIDQQTLVELVGQPLTMEIHQSRAAGAKHCLISFSLASTPEKKD